MSNPRFPSQKAEPATAPASGGRKIARELFGLFLLFWGLLVLLSLVTYHQGDPSLNHVVSNQVPVKNGAGLFGANISGMLVDVFGFAAFVWPAIFLAWGAGCVSTWFTMQWWRWFGFLMLGGCLISLGAAWNLGVGDVRGGGILGMTLFRLSENTLGSTGSLLLWFFLFFLSLELACGISWIGLMGRGYQWIRTKLAEHDITWQTLPEMLPRVRFSQMPLPRLGRSSDASGATVDVIPLLDIHTDPADEAHAEERTAEATGGFLFDDAIFAPPPSSQPDMTPPASVARPQSEVPEPFTAPVYTSSHTTSRVQAQPAPMGAAELNTASQPAGRSDARPVLLPVPPPPPARDKGVGSFLPRLFSALTAPKGASTPMPEPVMGTAAKPSATTVPHSAVSVARPVASGAPMTPVAVTPQASSTPPVPPSPMAASAVSPSPSAASVQQASARNAEPASRGSEVENESRTPAEQIDSQVFAAATAEAQARQPVMPNQPSGATAFARPSSAPSPVVMEEREAPRKKMPLKLPPIDLLQMPQQSDTLPSRAFMEEKGSRLMACLDDFGIRSELVRVTPGPVVTMFEIRPAPGVKVARIANLSQDLALSLKAESVRIQAPIPGSDTVGVEIPNEHRSTVNFRNILESDAFKEAESLLTMALGKDIGGHPEVADLARMPHVLVAGATGAGKSVCLNSLLVSILYKATPDEVKLLLVDPKKIELAVYADLPHLVHPVVTETPLAKTALDWAVNEMTERYTLMGRLKVRNITGYNEKLRLMGDTRPEGMEDLEPLPYLVIIIDELADLMMTGGKDVETSIVRLAQLARACGIHLIIATQRPSVDVVTGLIKANFPCRIAFQVANKYDSRTILDSVGAELLLGRGDMLFKPSGGKLRRLHGPFVSDDDVVAVVEYWKRQRAPSYRVDFSEWGNETTEAAKNLNIDASASDEEALYADIVAFATEPGQRISISKLQRRFRIGYNKAARLMERMEEDGVLEPAGVANRPREIKPR